MAQAFAERQTPQKRVLLRRCRPCGQVDRAGDATVNRLVASYAAGGDEEDQSLAARRPHPDAMSGAVRLGSTLVRTEFVVQAGADDGELVGAASDGVEDGRDVVDGVDHERTLVASAAIQVHVQALDLHRYSRGAEEVQERV